MFGRPAVCVCVVRGAWCVCVRECSQQLHLRNDAQHVRQLLLRGCAVEGLNCAELPAEGGEVRQGGWRQRQQLAGGKQLLELLHLEEEGVGFCLRESRLFQ